jgi:hypothetical protein
MPDIIEDLSESEAYLYAILEDLSGIDLAEFAWYDPDPVNPDGCFRAWPFQWRWFRCGDALQIDQTARSVGKTLSITLRMFNFPFRHAGQEAVITAPELVHLEPLTNLIERRFDDCRLGREMLPHGRSAVTHRPFMMNFVNGARLIGRIPQRDGKGIKGIHPLWLELDEAQDYPPAGWTELIETLKRGHEGATWRVHGVTRGIRDNFYEFTQDSPTNPWTIHRYTAMSRPNWTAEERDEKIRQYRSRDNPDYRRNVLGLHGDATNPLFVLHRLMKVVDDDLSSEYNLAEYQHYQVNHEQLVDRGGNRDVVEFLDFPERHRSYPTTWAGMDVGFTQHPSEILVFGEEKMGATTRLKLLTRVHLERISNPQQCRAISWVFDFYRPQVFAMDKTGVGLPLFQDLQQMAPAIANQIKGYNFSEKILVDFDEGAIAEMAEGDDDVKEAGIFRNVLEFSTDKLREMVDKDRLWLPWDTGLISEFQGQTWSYSKEAMDSYGRRRRVYSQGSFHALDAARMACLGYVQRKIEEMMRMRKQTDEQPVYDYVLDLG